MANAKAASTLTPRGKLLAQKKPFYLGHHGVKPECVKEQSSNMGY